MNDYMNCLFRQIFMKVFELAVLCVQVVYFIIASLNFRIFTFHCTYVLLHFILLWTSIICYMLVMARIYFQFQITCLSSIVISFISPTLQFMTFVSIIQSLRNINWITVEEFTGCLCDPFSQLSLYVSSSIQQYAQFGLDRYFTPTGDTTLCRWGEVL